MPEVLSSIIQAVFIIGFPFLAIRGVRMFKSEGWLSPIVVCYVVGILVRNVGLFNLNDAVSTSIYEGAIPIAIPMLLFSTNIKEWLQYARKSLFSFGLSLFAVVAVSAIAGFLFAGSTDENWILSGMLIGVYTGGTPNLMAIGLALEAREETVVLLNASDILCSGIYLVFLTSIAQKTLHLFLPKFQSGGDDVVNHSENMEHYFRRLKLITKIKSLASSMGISVLIAAISLGLTFLLYGEVNIAFLILCLTTLSIIGSFFHSIRKHKVSYELGQYLLLVFSVAMGLLSVFQELWASTGTILMFTAFVVIGSIIVHYALAAIFRIDADTVIITSTAAIFGPVFIGQVAGALKNKEIVFSGIVTGLVGYAVGNYLGIAVAYAIKALT